MKKSAFSRLKSCQYFKAENAVILPILLCLLPAQQVLAQQAASSSSLLEEIIVSARRMEENQQNVSIAITTLTANELQIKNITSFDQVQYAVPALSFSHSAGASSRLQLRGQSTAKNSDYPGVDRLFSEVPLQGASGPNASTLMDLESIQVLKGPQGVAFGRNSSGGAVLFYPQKPQHEFSAYAKAGYGNYDYESYEGMVNIPVMKDTLALRIVASQDKRDGWVTNIGTGHKLNERDIESIRTSLLYTPTDDLESNTVYFYEYSETLGKVNSLYAYNPKGLAATLYNPLVGLYRGPGSYVQYAEEAFALGREKININYEGGERRKATFFANTTSYDISDKLTVKNIFGLQTLKQSSGINMSGVPLPLIWLGVNGSHGLDKNRLITEELQLLYNHSSGIELVTGLFWSRQSPEDRGIPNKSITVGGLVISQPPATTEGWSVSSSFAPYAQVTFPLTSWVEGLSLTTGVRYTTDERRAKSIRTAANGIQTKTDVSGEWSDYNWEATLNYQARDNLLTYVAHRHGFKGGAFNPSARDPSLIMVEPEYVDDIELGLKWDWSISGIQGRTNASVYYQWYEDIVTNTHMFDSDGVAFTLNFNSAEATIKGGEIESTIQFNDRLSLSGYYSYVTSKVESQVGSPIPIDKLADIPEHKVSATLHYIHPLKNDAGDLHMAVTGYAQSEHYADQASEVEESLLSGYGLVNANFGWKEIYGSPLDITLFVNNAFDKEYFLSGADIYKSFGYVLSFYGEPRTYGVKFDYRWGQD